MAAEVLLVDRKEAARILCVGVRKVWELTNRGELPAVKVGRQAIRYRVADLRAWADSLPAVGTGDCPKGLQR